MDDHDSTNIMALMAERKIRQAMDEGQFDDLPGRGRPQALEDLSHLPPDLRLAYMILKNGGFLEGEGKQAANLRDLLGQSSGEPLDCAKIEKLKFLLARARRTGGESDPEALYNPEYLNKILGKI